LVMTVWFGVVVPLHPRGIIKLGGACAEMGGRACCRQDSHATHDSKPKPADSSCAICYFVATLDLPPAMGMDVPALGLAEQVVAAVVRGTPVIEWVDACSERGPPGV
jgi:hypothetical protein